MEEYINAILHDKESLKKLIEQIVKDIDFIDKKLSTYRGNSFKRIFCEFMLENIFYRKDSKIESYDKIESENIPVYSFRYKSSFNKSECQEYSKKLTKKHSKA